MGLARVCWQTRILEMQAGPGNPDLRAGHLHRKERSRVESEGHGDIAQSMVE